MSRPSVPTIAVAFGDPAGIGPEVVAKLFAHADVPRQARVVLVGDRWVWEDGQRVAGVRPAVREIGSPTELRSAGTLELPLFLPVDTVRPDEVRRGTACAACGVSVLQVLRLCLDLARAGDVGAICFAPLNKLAMKQGGLAFPDELHFFADCLGVRGFVCELNVLDRLWTTRVTSHIPLADVPRALNPERVIEAARLLYRALRAAGVVNPRVAVAGLNPHAGEGGTCGREEIDIIEPAMRDAQAEGLPLEGPFPPDTIFRRALAGLYDGILTMYHDQGQIAMKLMGFERGVTVQGGLPLPITTPAHGTAFDIAGQNKADAGAMGRAFALAARMATSKSVEQS